MFSFTTVTHKTSDTAHPLVMLTSREGARYFFGKVPEGTQRAINENRYKLGKLKSIFLTGKQSDWTELGGLPGLFLTISDSTKKDIDVFCGSPILAYIIATWRYFVFRKGVELKVQDLSDGALISDSTVAVTAVKVTPNSEQPSIIPNGQTLTRAIKKITSLMFPMDTSKVNSDDPYSYKSDPSDTEVHTHVKLPDPREIISLTNEPSTNYVVDFLPIRGKFDAKRAKELGIKPGPDYRKLAEGLSVENQDGKLVHPSEVVGESKTFPRVLILDIPNDLYRSSTLLKLSSQIDTPSADPIGLVYHFLGDDVDIRSTDYVEFLAKFDSNCTHVVSQKSSSDDSIIFKTAALNVLKLKALQADIFNLPSMDRSARLELPHNCVALNLVQQFDVLSGGVSVVETKPESTNWSELFDEHIAPLELNTYKERTIDETPISLDAIEGTLKDQVQVMTLGTGSAIPSLHRNVISTLIRIPKLVDGAITFRSVLLDGGENTLGTMQRNFGHNNQEQLNRVFQELDVIYLSHLHADHHLGIMSIIKRWFEINQDPSKKLFLVVPWQYNNFVTECCKLEPSQVDFSRITYVSCEEFLTLESRQFEFKQSTLKEFESEFDRKNINKKIPKVVPKYDDSNIQELYETVGINSISTCRAIHCSWAYSVSMDFKCSENESFKVSYSGDTRPNPRFAELGYGSDLLIHESSLAEDLIEEALAKKHSTMIEAVTMSKLMHCPKLILTHFSTRYSNKAVLSVDSEDLMALAVNLKQYLKEHGVGLKNGNILLHDTEVSPEVRCPASIKFEDLNICYAFDMMTIRYKDLILQRFNYNEMIKMFEIEELQNHSGSVERLESKKEQESKKQREKREAKRDQRLGKKRRTSENSI